MKPVFLKRPVLASIVIILSAVAISVFLTKKEHSLQKTASGDFRKKLSEAALSQAAVENAPVTFLITAVFDRTTKKYGQRGLPYVLMEAGHAAQNLLLQAESLDMGAVPIGAFSSQKISELIQLSPKAQPLYLIPVGYFPDQ